MDGRSNNLELVKEGLKFSVKKSTVKKKKLFQHVRVGTGARAGRSHLYFFDHQRLENLTAMSSRSPETASLIYLWNCCID